MLGAKVSPGRYGNLVGALDQGTSSTRFFVFASNTAELVTYHQIETKQYYPKEGWVEQDPCEILSSVHTCIDQTIEKLKSFETDVSDIKTIGVTNQRETIVVWDKITGKPLHNAIIWLDNRTISTVEILLKKRGAHLINEKCGLPISTYFSAVKLRWLLDNVPEVAKAVEEERCLFGTIDSWIIWNLTGNTNHGIHMTDVTNASRTMLMNINTLEWDLWLCKFFGIPNSILPSIKSCSEIYGYITSGSLNGTPISGCLGDQSAALVGQLCFKSGEAKNTYGTGCFLLCNTGRAVIQSKHGLLTTVAYKLGPNHPVNYAIEGSVAIAGAAIRWLRDNLNLIKSSSDIEQLASSVSGTHGVYFVPAFSGLFAPYWQPDARGIICGLTQFATKAHIARAAMEAVCFQTKEVLDAMNKDCGISLKKLQVDGGMTTNNLLMQIQADLLGIPIVRPAMSETTALGAALAAGIAQNIEVWTFPIDIASTTDTFVPSITGEERDYKYSMWKSAVKRSMHWNNLLEGKENELNYIYKALPGSFFLFTSFALLVLAEKLSRPSS